MCWPRLAPRLSATKSSHPCGSLGRSHVPGDRIYTVGFSGDRMLFLLGGLKVAAVGEYIPGGDETSAFFSAREAAQVFDEEPPELWKSEAHFVAQDLQGPQLKAHGDPFTPAGHEGLVLLDARGRPYSTPLTSHGAFETGLYARPQPIDRSTATMFHRLLDS